SSCLTHIYSSLNSESDDATFPLTPAHSLRTRLPRSRSRFDPLNPKRRPAGRTPNASRNARATFQREAFGVRGACSRFLGCGSWGGLGEGRLGTVKGRMARSMFGEFFPRGTRTPPFARLRCQAAARTSLQMVDRRSGFNET